MRTRQRWIIAALTFGLLLSGVAVVVSGGTDGRVQVDPQVALNTTEAACTAEVNFERCAAELFDTFDTDWLKAGEILTATAQKVSVSRYNIFCHSIAHMIGKRAAASGEMHIPDWALLCEGGYAHGVVAIEFDDDSVDGLIDRSLGWCNEVSDAPGAVYSCAHIVGHELWERAGSNADLVGECSRLEHPDSTRAATAATLITTLCRGGVYMEHFQSAEKQRGWVAAGASARTEDLLAICLSATVENGRSECFAMAFPALVLTSTSPTASGKGADGLKRCAELQLSDQEDCVIGIIAVTYSNTPNGPSGVEPLCATLAGTRGACYRQLAVATVRDTLDLEQAIAVCDLPGNPAAPACREFVEGWHDRNVTGTDVPASLLGASTN